MGVGTALYARGVLVPLGRVTERARAVAGGDLTAQIDVRGNDEIIHRINGVEVLRYQRPQLDAACKIAPAVDIVEAGGDVMLGYGHIALQAEGQPVWFRKIELMSLEKK